MGDAVSSIEFHLKKKVQSWESPSSMEVEIAFEDGGVQSYRLPLSCGKKLQQTFESYLGASKETITNYIDELWFQDAQARSHRILAQREHSIKELKDKLKRYAYSAAIIDKVLNSCIDSSYVNDARFAEIFIRSKHEIGWGKRRIERELMLRGINVSDLEGYPDDYFDIEDEYHRALAFLERRRVPEVNAYQKLFRLLYARGFDTETARKAVLARIENPMD